MAHVELDGRIDPGPYGLAYPVYTAALAATVLGRSAEARELAARDAWLALLCGHQLTEELGWSPDDAAYGGWGYSLVPLEKPPAGVPTHFDADLSSTLFAVGALRLSGVPPEAPEIRKALRFVERCQDLDGGFFFTPTHALQNLSLIHI